MNPISQQLVLSLRFLALDSNGDGMLSIKEISAALKVANKFVPNRECIGHLDIGLD